MEFVEIQRKLLCAQKKSATDMVYLHQFQYKLKRKQKWAPNRVARIYFDSNFCIYVYV